MTQITYSQTMPMWLKIVAAIGVVWYAFGLMQFFLGYTMDTSAAVTAGTITAPHAAAIDGTPTLIWASFAIASLAGLIGAALLFMGSPRANLAFTVSIISAAVYYIWIYALSGTGADRPSEETIIALVVLAVTAGFWIISKRTA